MQKIIAGNVGLMAAMMAATAASSSQAPESRPASTRPSKRRIPIPSVFPDVTAEKRAEINIRKGLTLFDIDGQKIWALNHKNAIRKAYKANQ
ncbi:hypothetical protein [Spirosoma validum]|uniref:Uncharacterized protein n=1 Tax=Spirosoma validum TaxID=2771355 RepID=A0A927B1U5_9BACT|nr:hypothetical protein [Spirosoma validum]MBD2753824.1 hypothetical protein [Spirosoma validum]